ncbi:hypothetical protein GEMRC1_012269 [Eukaryota sp. GEM-RC1]
MDLDSDFYSELNFDLEYEEFELLPNRTDHISPLPLSRLHSPTKQTRVSRRSLSTPAPVSSSDIPRFSPIGSNYKSDSDDCHDAQRLAAKQGLPLLFTQPTQSSKPNDEICGSPNSPFVPYSSFTRDTSSDTSSLSSARSVSLNRRGTADSASPISRKRFKEFVERLKQHDKLEDCVSIGNVNIPQLPEKVRWKAYVELGDLARRYGDSSVASTYFNLACQTQPHAPQPWLELSRLYEDIGNYEMAVTVLEQSLEEFCCGYCEPIVLKLLKLYEKFHKYDEVRSLLFLLRNENPQQSWRILTEGALFEARRGRYDIARRVFKFLLINVSHQGPLYLDAVKMEIRLGSLNRAVKILVKGLRVVPRYGPLWFIALRLMEFIWKDGTFVNYLISQGCCCATLPSIIESFVNLSEQSICKELVWKIRCESAQILTRVSRGIGSYKMQLAKALVSCPKALQWKVWHIGARTEAYAGCRNEAIMLIERALTEAPIKSLAGLIIDYARIYELFGELQRAADLLQDPKFFAKDWRIALEAVMFCIRTRCASAALEVVKSALYYHRLTGRLWALYVQLSIGLGGKVQLDVFNEARVCVPKSGELWCDAARVRLNPFANRFSLSLAKQYLMVAAEFTPQYGDTFIELIRLRLLRRGLGAKVDDIERMCVSADPNYGLLWDFVKNSPLEPVSVIFKRAKSFVVHEIVSNARAYQLAITSSLSSRKSVLPETHSYDACHLGTGLSVFNSVMIGSSLRMTDVSSRYITIFGMEHFQT